MKKKTSEILVVLWRWCQKNCETSKECDLLVSLNIPSNSYHAILSDFEETCSYLNEMLILMSSEAEKSKASL